MLVGQGALVFVRARQRQPTTTTRNQFGADVGFFGRVTERCRPWGNSKTQNKQKRNKVYYASFTWHRDVTGNGTVGDRDEENRRTLFSTSLEQGS